VCELNDTASVQEVLRNGRGLRPKLRWILVQDATQRRSLSVYTGPESLARERTVRPYKDIYQILGISRGELSNSCVPIKLTPYYYCYGK
jgi:hypothetical protein